MNTIEYNGVQICRFFFLKHGVHNYHRFRVSLKVWLRFKVSASVNAKESVMVRIIVGVRVRVMVMANCFKILICGFYCK